ncbi:MAG: tRNA 2-thiocytidine(32) synthetase TtcA [Parasporobacterium sp.]|nr:tRNA 2-thiocytidine(32) synthetase TtcA [Parasporobacterium sp.]
MTSRQLLSQTRRAIDDFGMINDGDMIAIGVSGGKDSLSLLYAMKQLSRFYPHPFQIHAVTVDLGFGNLDLEQIAAYCEDLEVPYHIAETQIAEIVFNQRQESNPCSLCAKMRKGAFNQFVKELGCNKTAFGHHKDDLVQTMLMSLIFEGRFHTFEPVTVLDRSGLTLIRPFIYINEADIKGFINKYQITPLKNPCPADGNTSRQQIAELLSSLNRTYPGVKDRMFTAIMNQLIPH